MSKHPDDFTAWARRWGVPDQALAELFALDGADDHGDVTGRSEASVVRACRLEADQAGAVLWRNNSGATFDQNGRMVRYGLGNDSKKLNASYKSPDLVGIGPGGRFLGVECKAPGWRGPSCARDEAQANFGNHVRSLGGLFTFATEPAHVRRLFVGT